MINMIIRELGFNANKKKADKGLPFSMRDGIIELRSLNCNSSVKRVLSKQIFKH